MVAQTAGEDLQQVAERLRAARRVVAFSGAGMSAESGIATFRGGDDSLWQCYDPQQLATAEAFRTDAELVWGWYMWRAAMLAQAEPNAGHRTLAALQAVIDDLRVVTQNVDDLHERAGSRGVVHLHGELLAARCFACAAPFSGPWVDVALAHSPRQRLTPPRCRECGQPVRPGVVWFGEALPEAAWDAAVQAVAGAELVFVIGTSGLVYPAAGLVSLARDHGATVVEINPQASAVSPQAQHVLRGAAAGVLDALCQSAFPTLSASSGAQQTV